MASLLQYIKKHGTWSFLVMAAIASTMTGAISFLAPLYPVMLAVAAAVCVTKMKKTSMPLVIMAAACVLSLAFNHPPAIFKPWYRLAYFLLLLLALTPLTSSRLLNAFRLNLFLWLMRFCVFIGAGSFIGYFLGINYMRYNTSEMINVAGLFGGLVWQSITLGLLAGLGLVYLTVLHLENRDSGRKETKLRLGLMVACLGSILLSASRSALVATLMGVGYVFFMYFRHAPKAFPGAARPVLPGHSAGALCPALRRQHACQAAGQPEHGERHVLPHPVVGRPRNGVPFLPPVRRGVRLTENHFIQAIPGDRHH